MRLTRLIAMIATAFLFSPCVQGEVEAAAPKFRVGDTWTFDNVRSVDDRVPFTQTVLSIEADKITVLNAPSGKTPSYSPTMMPLDPRGTEIANVRFPLTVGAKWEVRHDWIDGKHFGTISKDCEVVAFERVVVPAGEFEAYRLTGTGWNKDKAETSPIGGDLHLTEIYWYAPAVKRVIKYQGKQTKYFPGQHVEVWSRTLELKSYTLAE